MTADTGAKGYSVQRIVNQVLAYSFTLLFFLALSLAACARGETRAPQATPTAPATSLPPTPAATPTPAPPSVLDVFPLRLGATWVYSVTVDYDWDQKPAHWSGTITETITSATVQGDAYVFDVQRQGAPPDISSWLFAINRYIARRNSIYRLTSSDNLDRFLSHEPDGSELSQLVTWPLQVGQQWGEPQYIARGDGFYVWRVDAQENVTTAAGTFNNCYRLMYLTNPDDTRLWFCPGIGFTRREYHHHGSRLDEVWELAKR